MRESEEIQFLSKSEPDYKNNNKLSSYRDPDFRYHFLLDFFTFQLTCFLITFFMLGMRDIIGQDKLENMFHRFWYLALIPGVLIILEMILVYFFFKKIVLLEKPCLIIFLYLIFIFLFAMITCMCCLLSVVTCIIFEGLICLNITSFIIMNSIKAMEDKNIIKLFVLYLNTFTVIIIYIATINIRYIVFFILATSSVLYFSYVTHYYKRLVLINFPHFDRQIKDNDNRLYGQINNMNSNNDLNINRNNFNSFDEEATKFSLITDEQNLKEKRALEKFSMSMLSKISFIASFVDTTVYNFS